MDEQQVNGGFNQAAGRVQDAAGALAGDMKQQAAGKMRALKGQAQSLYGDVVDNLEHAATDNPLAALGAALGVGLALGLLIGRR
jgi:uncharacterized protein YjbJ (UPF0337 family)